MDGLWPCRFSSNSFCDTYLRMDYRLSYRGLQVTILRCTACDLAVFSSNSFCDTYLRMDYRLSYRGSSVTIFRCTACDFAVFPLTLFVIHTYVWTTDWAKEEYLMSTYPLKTEWGRKRSSKMCAELQKAVQALGQLVSLNWIHYCTYICDLSSS